MEKLLHKNNPVDFGDFVKFQISLVLACFLISMVVT